jgi:hypothetical protein
MKIRIGVGAGGACSTTDPLAELVTSLDQLGFDSLWLSEVLISSEHFGVSIGYAGAPIDPGTARMMIARRPRALELTPVGLPALRELIERFIAVSSSSVRWPLLRLGAPSSRLCRRRWVASRPELLPHPPTQAANRSRAASLSPSPPNAIV